MVGWSPSNCSMLAPARLCHLWRVSEACAHVTDLICRRLEGCAASKPHELEFLHPEEKKSGDEAEEK